MVGRWCPPPLRHVALSQSKLAQYGRFGRFVSRVAILSRGERLRHLASDRVRVGLEFSVSASYRSLACAFAVNDFAHKVVSVFM